jgi:hypothetical protein
MALTESNRKDLNKALADLARAVPEIDRAEQVGRDVAPYRQRVESLRQKIITVKRVYWPMGD